jgi:hypothetical protein
MDEMNRVIRLRDEEIRELRLRLEESVDSSVGDVSVRM